MTHRFVAHGKNALLQVSNLPKMFSHRQSTKAFLGHLSRGSADFTIIVQRCSCQEIPMYTSSDNPGN
ncbi:hypothetical protein XELAEV_18044100mg [Xenopus laevis]|uniref:Uncharacterized protein n=1 Tax=Xenopus laevis TaxID=8355 RepID=A0A974BYF4_XENLA|nr:hypothetical protein XELAEV_18044100mg [Xenopus laevis]